MDPETHLDATIAFSAPKDAAGVVVGRYHLLQKIGEGGMGEVWLAEQREPVRRRVALKVVKAGMNSREVIARFESERQALALMDHPAIARVLDAGATLQGAPYFVMEYVAGVSITEYCDQHKLSTRDRLELFVHVCEGVQHAHQKAIIHRDLKPSNIIVTEVDGKAAPKIIDFGVAKALTQKLTQETMFTRIGSLIGTPEYMSPEQANTSGEDIDTRTDVYSLGIIFYELLVGTPPIDLKKVALAEFLRRLRDEDAPKPSTKFRTQDGPTSTSSAHNRRTEPLELAKQLRGDLDSIALKALEKDRARRYATAADFGADVGRYLRNELVLAVPPSAAYRASKFAHRYRAALATFCAFLLVLIAAAGISIWQGVRATRQRDRADAEAAVSKAVTEFLQDDLLSQASPDSQGGAEIKPDPDVKVKTLVDRAAEKVGKKFANQPLVESAIRRTIGNTYRGLGLWPLAEAQIKRAYDLAREHRGADDMNTIETQDALAAVLADEGKLVESSAMQAKILEIETRKLGANDPRTVVAMQALGESYSVQGKLDLAQPLLKKALEQQTRNPGYDNIKTLDTSDTLAYVFIQQYRYAEAAALLTKGLESYRRVFGPDHPFTQREMFGLARVLYGEGKYTESEALVQPVLNALRHTMGPEHPNTLSVARYLGQVYTAEGRSAEAVALLEPTVQSYRATLGPLSNENAYAEQRLAAAYEANKELTQAETAWRDSLTAFNHMGKNGEGMVPAIMDSLGSNLVKQSKFSEGESLLRQALSKQKAGTWEMFHNQATLGAALLGQKKYAEAEPLLLQGYEGLEKQRDHASAANKKFIGVAGEQVVELYTEWGKPQQAADWRAKVKAA